MNRLSGNVMDILYSGRIIRLKVKLAKGDLVVVKKVVSFERSTFTIGDKVTITISPKNILVYNYPENLNTELALE